MGTCLLHTIGWAAQVNGTFTGYVTSTNGVWGSSQGIQINDPVHGEFAYDLIPDGNGNVTPSFWYGYMGIHLTDSVGVGSTGPGYNGVLQMSIGSDGLPSNAYAFNGLSRGFLYFINGVGSGSVLTDTYPYGGIDFTVTNYTLIGYVLPNTGIPVITSIKLQNSQVIVQCATSNYAKYSLQYSTNQLSELSWSDISTNIADGAGLIIFTNTVSGDSAFYRLRAL